MSNETKGVALITGASAGIGATYADRLARRGYDLLLAARDAARLEALAVRLRAETGVKVEVLQTDLTDKASLGRLEARLRSDEAITLLVNNAGAASFGTFVESDADRLEALIDLNVVAVTRLANAAGAAFVKRGKGTIVNVGSVVGLLPEYRSVVYGATKAFVLHLSQALGLHLGPQGVYVQAVLPSATRTELWGHAGVDVDTLTGVMEVDDLVDAALVGFDRREPVTIPPLHDAGQWAAFEAARRAMIPGFRQSRPADRYLANV